MCRLVPRIVNDFLEKCLLSYTERTCYNKKNKEFPYLPTQVKVTSIPVSNSLTYWLLNLSIRGFTTTFHGNFHDLYLTLCTSLA